MSERDDEIFILTLILNFIIILITFFLILLYLITGEFYSYPCAHILNISLILCIDNIVRVLLIPKSWNKIQILQYFQAFLLVFFDKMILSILSMQIIVIYIGIIKTEIYEKNEKKIFIFGTLTCIAISAILTILFIAIPQDITSDEDSELYYYCLGNWAGKNIIDSIFNAILLCINFLCTIAVLIYYAKKKKAAEEGSIEDLGYKKQYIRFIVLFFVNVLIIVEIYLIIYDSLIGNYDLIYLFSCLIIDLCYSINSTVINETKKIFCRNKISNSTINPDVLIKKNTFGEDGPEDELSDDD